MRRKRLLVTLGLLLLFLGAASTTLLILLKNTPVFYKSSTLPEGEERSQKSGEFVSRYLSLGSSIVNHYPDWWEVFTADQVNAFLQQDFLHSYGGDNNLPDGFHDLRVQIIEGHMRLGCRYGTGFWSTIVSVDLKMWLIAGEVNRIGVELVSLRAGALPVSRQLVIDHITEAARRNNIEVKWYHRRDNPVAILKLQADQARPTIQIQRFELQPGRLVIVGRSTESQIGTTTSRSSPR